MKFSKQTMLGTGVFLGGSLLLYSVIHQVQQTNSDPLATATVESATHATAKTPTPDPNPLTADIATEQKILAQKQKEREQRVNELDQQAEQYLTEQQRIEAAALARSRAENQLYAEKNAPVVTVPVVTPRPVETVTNVQQPTTTTVTTTTTESVAPKPQITSKSQVEAPQATTVEKANDTRPTSYQIKKGEGLIALSRRYNVPVSVLAKANNLSTNANLHPGQVLTIPSESQVARIQQSINQEAIERQNQLQAQKVAAEQAKAQAQIQEKLKAQQEAQALAKQKADKQAQLLAEKQAKIDAQKAKIAQQQAERQAKIAEQQALKKQQELEKAQKIQAEKDRKAAYQANQQKLKEARQTVKETDAKGTFGVQVALAADDQKAEEIAKKLRSAGYSVKTSKTTKGTRVVVGPEKGKIAALALKDKVNSDPRVGMGGGWVLYW